MLAATHAVAGAIIASQVANPEIGYAAAIISHPLLDLFPHWDLSTRHTKKTKFKIIWTSLLDAGIGFGIGWILFGKSVATTPLLLTMFLAQIFDWLEAPYHVFDWSFFPFGTIKKLQHFWHTKLDLPWGLVWQVVILGVAIYLA